jgi:3-methyladenine DNA glycosylase AlkC
LPQKKKLQNKKKKLKIGVKLQKNLDKNKFGFLQKSFDKNLSQFKKKSQRY